MNNRDLVQLIYVILHNTLEKKKQNHKDNTTSNLV